MFSEPSSALEVLSGPTFLVLELTGRSSGLKRSHYGISPHVQVLCDPVARVHLPSHLLPHPLHGSHGNDNPHHGHYLGKSRRLARLLILHTHHPLILLSVPFRLVLSGKRAGAFSSGLPDP